ncbi:DHA2 family efflux MFS transporter permease subunit [Aureibacter tunicatorum]|uniref:DHA2 family multidrug resistance protein n=1 Tax=Aureibacter tunicatorum TaxID=866807 RepID=A0AAE4BU36_9BACT|nr:DHA2 family efflux MFS transporter permease subunit [Aureibacter tunicatorum]MDR6240312.1 DHA2 family multidrug resistance protein [Aureibacter tunicatorum]BDD05807.1 MFS transporter [Aureibacter tunicatorum]
MPKSLDFKSRIVIVTVMAAAIIEILDATVVNVALPYIMGSLGSTITEVGWVISAYAISNIVMVALSPWMSAKLGRKRFYTFSILIFTVSSLFCGISDTTGKLVLFRFLQGLGGGALLATSQAILVETLPKEKIGLANALFGGGLMVGRTLAPLVGGYFTEYISWHWVFFINLPIGFAACILSYIFISEPKDVRKVDSFDWWGFLLLIAGVSSLQIVLQNGQEAAWFTSDYIYVLTIVAFLSLTLFIMRLLTAEKPLIDIKVFKDISFTSGTIILFIVSIGMSLSFLVLPLFVINILDYSPFQIGLIALPGGITSLVLLPILGKLPQKKIHLIIYLSAGNICVYIFGYMLSHINLYAGPFDFLIPVIIRGLGFSLIIISLNTIALIHIRGKLIPEGTAALHLLRKIGNALGVAFATEFILVRTDFHFNWVKGYVNPVNRVTNDYRADLLAAFDSFSADMDFLNKTIDIKLYDDVLLQSTLLTYLDCFMMVGYFFLLCIPLAFIALIKPKNPETVEISNS